MQPLQVAEEHAATDRELGQEDMENSQPTDHEALHQRAQVNHRIVFERQHQINSTKFYTGHG